MLCVLYSLTNLFCKHVQHTIRDAVYTCKYMLICMVHGCSSRSDINSELKINTETIIPITVPRYNYTGVLSFVIELNRNDFEIKHEISVLDIF